MSEKVSNLRAMMEAHIQRSMEAMALRDIYAECKASPTAFENWIGAVEGLGILSPRSIMVSCPETFTAELMDGLELSQPSEDFLAAVCVAVKTMAEETGYPVFVKNSFTSSKHDWKDSCSFMSNDRDEVLRKLSAMASYLSQAPTPYAGNIIVREMIPTDPVFFAFNEMPVTQEFRVFARDGKVEAYQPYWPLEAFVGHEPEEEDWLIRLEGMKVIKPSDLKHLIQQSEAVTAKLGGFWSVDFLKGKDGKWWLIDMAEGNISYVNRADIKVLKSVVRDQETSPSPSP
jgi:hypothetical protein